MTFCYYIFIIISKWHLFKIVYNQESCDYRLLFGMFRFVVPHMTTDTSMTSDDGVSSVTPFDILVTDNGFILCWYHTDIISLYVLQIAVQQISTAPTVCVSPWPRSVTTTMIAWTKVMNWVANVAAVSSNVQPVCAFQAGKDAAVPATVEITRMRSIVVSYLNAALVSFGPVFNCNRNCRSKVTACSNTPRYNIVYPKLHKNLLINYNLPQSQSALITQSLLIL